MLASEMSLLDDDDSDESLDEMDPICEYVDENGVRCRNHARPGSDYCGVHDPEGESLI